MTSIRPKDGADDAKRGLVLWSVLLLLVGCLVLAWLFLPLRQWMQSFTAWSSTFGLFGAVSFIFVYIIAVAVLAPVWPLSIAAGFAFGLWGLPLVVTGATIGALVAFLIARFLLRERVRTLTRKRRVLDAVDRAVAEEGWKIVILLRLSPLVPFNLQNYFLGATDIAPLPYALATFFGIMPGSAAYVYLGTLGRLAASEGAGGIRTILLTIGLVATAVLVGGVARKARRKLEDLGVDKGEA